MTIKRKVYVYCLNMLCRPTPSSSMRAQGTSPHSVPTVTGGAARVSPLNCFPTVKTSQPEQLQYALVDWSCSDVDVG